MSVKIDNPKWSEVPEDHSMSKMMNSLIEGHYKLCAEAGISPWDFCVMLANVQGIILGLSKDMPIEKAIERIEKLGEVSQLRLHEERAPPTSKTIS